MAGSATGSAAGAAFIILIATASAAAQASSQASSQTSSQSSHQAPSSSSPSTSSSSASSAPQSPHQAQETVVVTATAAPSPLGNTGRSVDVITREDLDALPVATTMDALRLLSSVEVRSRGPFGVQSDFSVRGAGFGQALVLVDGVRLNDAQSGHHNGDIPVPLNAVARIEVLRGAGSSLHGADAFGGTINIITRGAVTRPSLDLAGGSWDLFEASAAAGLTQSHRLTHTFQGSFSRSSGFMPARDHRVSTLAYQAQIANRGRFSFAHADKEFGANGFYGPAPSREWTKQTLLRYAQPLLTGDRWQGTFQTSYRTHGDHYIYDERTPALSNNEHRTHAVTAQAKLHYSASAATQISAGVETGGDWIRSSALGDHDFARASVFTEVRQSLGERVTLHPGVRFDTYSRFGSAWSPSLAASLWSSSRLKFRASAGRVFRVPTFTELYYRDPNHQATGELDPEKAWATDAGVDVFLAEPWTASFTVFGRWEDNVIDWVRPSTAERWHTTNIRQVDTRGVEASLRRRFGTHGEAGLQYTRQRQNSDALNLLSKYALDYATQSLAASGVARAGGWTAGPRIEFKHRVDGREYWLVEARLGRRLTAGWEAYVDGLNLLDTTYQEIVGVAMPGRAIRVGLRTR
jgi:iron complex outermembrane receptor protein